jgi:UDP-N-acetylglucosamine acyltransferase
MSGGREGAGGARTRPGVDGYDPREAPPRRHRIGWVGPFWRDRTPLTWDLTGLPTCPGVRTDVADQDGVVHPTAVIGPGVHLGTGVRIGPHAVLLGPLEGGDRVLVGAGSVLGAPPEIMSVRQNLAWDGDLDHAGVVLEDDVVVRENVVVHTGTHRPTRIGAGTWLLAGSYVAHDVVLGRRVVVSAGVSIGGHCDVGDGTNLGLNAAVHQRRVVGPGAMIGMSTAVTRDVPPFALVHGSPPRLHDVNRHALTRAGHDAGLADELFAFYRGAADLARLPDVGATGPLAALAADLAWWSAHTDLRPVRLASSATDE